MFLPQWRCKEEKRRKASDYICKTYRFRYLAGSEYIFEEGLPLGRAVSAFYWKSK